MTDSPSVLPATLQFALDGRYVIERELGRGGMATVYLARDLRHARRVALKVVRAEVAAAVAAERFLREIQIAARLQHPHILPLHESGEAAGLLYYVMPYVEGESLRQRLARERQLPLRDALRITREVANALDYAHRQRVVHRDIKPANILLSDGHAVVADFGIARAVSEAATERLTESGLVVGTPEYMSPEQVTGERELDGRSDVFSLGCVLYAMLAGEPPFRGPTPQASMMRRVFGSASPLRTLRPSLPQPLERVVMTAIATAPADRFQTAKELEAALEAFDPATPSGPASASSRARRRAPIVAAGAVFLVAALAAGVLSRRESGTLLVERFTQLTHAPELEIDPALSPDGALIAYAAEARPSQATLYVRQVSGGRAVPLADSVVGVRLPRWSPNGTHIAFHTHDGIYAVPALGGPARRLVGASSSPELTSIRARVHSAAWSPDGASLAYAADSAIFVLSLSEGTTRRVTTAFQPHALSWSPDGSWLAYASGNVYLSTVGEIGGLGNVAPSAICVVRPEGGSSRVLTDRVTLNTSPAWMPDGRTLLFISNRTGVRDIYSVRLRRDGSTEGAPVRLTTGLNAHSISLSADGRRLSYATFALTSNIWSVEVNGSRVWTPQDGRPVTHGDQLVEGIGLSPDGRWLAFDSNLSGNQDIYRIASFGGESERLTHDAGDDFVPRWSPDGREIAFYSTRHGSRDIFVMNADGSAQRRVTDSPGQEVYPDWSPDGRQLAYAGPGGLYSVSREPTGVFGQSRLLVTPGGLPTWSPDGRWIAYVAPDRSIRLVSPLGDQTRTIVNDAGEARSARAEWSRDGRALYYWTIDAQRKWTLREVAISGGTSRVLLHRLLHRDDLVPGADGFATDGRKFYFTLAGAESNVWMVSLRPK